MDHENYVVVVGDAWKFHAEQEKKHYVGVIESMFLNKRLKHATLEVRWLCHEEEACEHVKLKKQKRTIVFKSFR